MNQKFIVKFEQGTLEQSFKLNETDVVDGVNGVFEILDDLFIGEVIETFMIMRKSFLEAYNRFN
ncbi:hypothetical protein [Sphingobacterium suaedae]|uniref:Uncharacterized protein n=1 Tax=Sphingobacterium suaedae TaxID=1686402 RepID=A0ABW5KEZ8_9SPHI